LPIPLTEELRSIANAAKWLPTRRGDRPAHASSLFRWAKYGLRGVRLETIRVGGTLCTSKEALERFFARLAERDDPHAPDSPVANPTPPKPASRRQREIAEAARQAEAALR
jgi:hypothetical protein